MTSNALKITLSVTVLTLAATMFSCNKIESASKTEAEYSGISELDQIISAENENLKTEGILDCIYNCINAMPYEIPSADETALLQFVREEELLAHDVYAAMYSLYPIPVFNNISNSETIHTIAIKALLEKYNLPDPGLDHQAGIFQNTEIQQLYDALILQGSASLNEALVVGAIIEDYDIADLIDHIENHSDNVDIDFVLTQLYRGSRNHLRAFHRHLTFRNISYTPQYISQQLYDQITNSGWEVGGGFCICQFAVTEGRQKIIRGTE